MISDNELDSMAQEAIKFMPSRVKIYRNRGGDNQQGGEIKQRDLIGDNIPADLKPGGTNAILRNIADRAGIIHPWTIYLPAFTDVESEDEIEWNTRKFIVIQPFEQDFEVQRECLLDEIV